MQVRLVNLWSWHLQTRFFVAKLAVLLMKTKDCFKKINTYLSIQFYSGISIIFLQINYYQIQIVDWHLNYLSDVRIFKYY